MFKEIDEMTGKVFENPEDRQIMMVQVWLVEQDFLSNFLIKEHYFIEFFLGLFDETVLMGICLKKNLVPRVPSLLERFFNGLVPCK